MRLFKLAACALAVLCDLTPPVLAVPAGNSVLSGSLPVTSAITTTATTTTGHNTFTVDSSTASKLSVGMSVISSAFPYGAYISALSGTTVTVAILNGTGNALTTGSATVQFGLNRVWTPYFGATTILGTQGYFGSAATGNTTWSWKYVTAPDYPGQASIVSLNDGGQSGGYFASHTANLTSANNSSTYGAFLNAVNDNPTYANNVWGFYVQCEQAPGAAQRQTFCAELTPVNYGAAGSAVDPYTNNSGQNVETLRLDGGGGPGTSEGSDVLHLIGNGSKTLHGIDISADLLDMTADPHAPALALPQNAAISWYSAANQKGWSIFDATSTNVQNTLSFSETKMTSTQPIAVPGGSQSAPGLQLGGTGTTGIYNTGGSISIGFSGGAPIATFTTTLNEFGSTGIQLHARLASCSTNAIAAAATDFSIEITVAPSSGSCAVTLPAFTAAGFQLRVSDATGSAATHNIVVTPAAGNIDGSANYTISTNWGSWSGEQVSSMLTKTVAKF
jgi:hypothetical protein